MTTTPTPNYYFALTHSGERTNICADFTIYNKTMFLAKIQEGKNYLSTIRYGLLGENVKLLKFVNLKEFNELFAKGDFTELVMKHIFSKTIYESFYPQPKLKYLTVKELVVGGVYKMDTYGYKEYVYLGKVTQEKDLGEIINNIFIPNGKSTTKIGFGLNYYCAIDDSYSDKIDSPNYDHLKIQETIKNLRQDNLADLKILKLQPTYTTLQSNINGTAFKITTTLNQLPLC